MSLICSVRTDQDKPISAALFKVDPAQGADVDALAGIARQIPAGGRGKQHFFQRAAAALINRKLHPERLGVQTTRRSNPNCDQTQKAMRQRKRLKNMKLTAAVDQCDDY